LALSAYARTIDTAAAADARQQTANSFTLEYERLAALDHPDLDPIIVAIADEHSHGIDEVETLLGLAHVDSLESSPRAL
jgi:hypothetical protein